MAGFLLIESSTKTCSVGVSVDNKLIALKEQSSENYIHAELLHVFIESTLEEAKFEWADMDAVCVSKGPGSYTGLRIGVSSAKGFCFGAKLKLIAISSLKSLANKAIMELPGYDYYIPMLDARRMEVYTQVFDAKGDPVDRMEALILQEDSFKELCDKGNCLFFGDGSTKFQSLASCETAVFKDVDPGIEGMVADCYDKYEKEDFEDVVDFEPLYLKEFIAGKKSE